MSRLLRMAYGQGGTRLGRILVSVPHAESAPAPRRLRLLLLVVWILVPVLVSLYAVPTATHLKTVIDISHLEVKPPPEPPVIEEPPRPKPVEPPPAPLPEQPVQKTVEPQLPKELPRPAITRPSVPRVIDAAEYQPRIARERSQVDMEAGTPAAARIRRETAVSEAPSARTNITRTRGAAAPEAPPARERVASLRRAPAAEGPAQGGAVTLQPLTRSARPAVPSGSAEGLAPRIAATRERTGTVGSGGGGDTASVGLVRGVSLASLAICSTPQAEEDAVRAVLGVVGSRRSCTDDKGEFQFKGTKRISSFNLVIFPAKGRRPSNRCEELENAYRCLKTR